MLETSARLLWLLSLFQVRRYWSGADLAQRLEVTTRTLRRDVDKLRTLGYPIDSTAGVEGGYQLGSGSEMPPLLLDDDEAVAVSLGLQSVATSAVVGIQEASVRALAKIGQMLPARLARRVGALHSVVVTTGRQRADVDARTISTIAAACRDCESLRFRYKDHSGRDSSRSVEPCRLVYTGYVWYLIGWDQNRGDWRTFRVDRIHGRIALDARFVARKPPAEDLAEYVSRGAARSFPRRARVRLRGSAADVASRVPVWIGTIEPFDDQFCFLHVSGPTPEIVAAYILMLGIDFEIMDAPELVRELQRVSDRIRSAVKSPKEEAK